MSQDDQIRWDRQHGESQGREQPALFLRQVFESGHADITAGRALDIACGSGRNALFLAKKVSRLLALTFHPLPWGTPSREP